MYQPSEPLERAACLALLATQTLGRLVFTRRALPDVVPAHYRLDGENVLLRLGLGSAAAIASAGAVVAFEADHFDPASGTGWSVTVVGQAHEVEPVPGPGITLCLPAARITGHHMVVTPTQA